MIRWRCAFWVSLLSLMLASRANQEKREKNIGAGNILKRIGQGVYYNLLLSCSPSIFLPVSLSLCILYSLFHEGKDTSAIPQLSVHHLVFVFPILFCFHKGFNNFHLSKISELISFFTETCVSSYLLFHDASELLLFFEMK